MLATSCGHHAGDYPRTDKPRDTSWRAMFSHAMPGWMPHYAQQSWEHDRQTDRHNWTLVGVEYFELHTVHSVQKKRAYALLHITLTNLDLCIFIIFGTNKPDTILHFMMRFPLIPCGCQKDVEEQVLCWLVMASLWQNNSLQFEELSMIIRQEK